MEIVGKTTRLTVCKRHTTPVVVDLLTRSAAYKNPGPHNTFEKNISVFEKITVLSDIHDIYTEKTV